MRHYHRQTPARNEVTERRGKFSLRKSGSCAGTYALTTHIQICYTLWVVIHFNYNINPLIKLTV
jgi:hypothetical protein